MAYTYIEILIKIVVTLLFLTFAIAVPTQGYAELRKFLQYADQHDGIVMRCLKHFFGIFGFLAGSLLAAGMLIYNLSHEDREKSILKPTEIYSRQLSTGTRKEAITQTNADMMVTLLTSFHSTVNIPFTPWDSPSISSSPEFPIWCGLKNRPSSSSSPALHFNSFNFDSTGLIVSYDKFQIAPETFSVTFDDVGGSAEVKQAIRQYVVEPFIQAWKSQGEDKILLDVPRSVLITGEEGTGKSLIILAILNEFKREIKQDIKFYKINGSNCFGSFIGSGATFRDLFHYANNHSPIAIILFENIDQLHDRSVSILISEIRSMIQGKMLFFATTSQPNRLHEKLRSSTAFDYIYQVDLPNFWERVIILCIHLGKRGCSVKKTHVIELANLTSTYTGRELEKLAIMISVKALERHYHGYLDRLKSYAKSREIQDCNNNEPICTSKAGSSKIKQVGWHNLIQVLQAFEKNRPKGKRNASDKGNYLHAHASTI